jgi:hypothetical protein
MADKKISALTASATPLAGTEVLPIVQSGSTVKVAVSNLTAGRAVSATQLTLSSGNLVIGTTAKGITTGSAIPLGLGVNNAVTAITIDTASNVGIANTTPRGLLHVGTSASAADIPVPTGNFAIVRAGTYGSGGTGGVQLSGGYGDAGRVAAWQIKSVGSGIAGSFVNDLLFTTQNSFSGSETERMRLDASGNVGIGATAAATAILDVQSTTKGVRFPNMTTVQKNAITPSAGTVIFDTTLAKLCVYSGAAWQTITSV